MKTTRKRLERAGRAGFTLIEVLLVVVIIGILVGVAVPKMSGKVQKAQMSRAKADIQQIGMALGMYEIDNGQFPGSLQALVAKSGASPNWDGPYLDKGIPKDPWGNEYIYSYPGQNRPHSFDLSSSGPPGGPVIGNWETD